MEYKNDTIAAIATPVGIGGIGIVKISGNLAEDIAKKLFRPSNSPTLIENFKLYLGHIIDPESGYPIDEVLLSIMRGPLSYTREDVVEINSHSGYAILSRILQLILQYGARLAKPGEFTLRAFINGRIDLTQAEAVVDLINAKSETSLYLASRQLSGGLLARLERIRAGLFDILVEIEASIDFPEDQPIQIDRSDIEERIRKDILKPVKELVSAFSQRNLWQEGVATVIAGRVNVGKSSIFNGIIQNEKALVTPIPGTTRDIIEYGINIKGIPIRLMDTAGIRKVRGIIENKGLNLTKISLSSADIILLVIDGSKLLTKYDVEILRIAKTKRIVVVINKIDLPRKVSEKKLTSVFVNIPKVFVSAATGEGFSALTDTIYNSLLSHVSFPESDSIIPNLRHTIALRKVVDHLKKAATNIKKGLPLEIIAADLAWVNNLIDEITGKRTSEEVLDSVFNRFCIGK
jgi:tRNA modification GTPase